MKKLKRIGFFFLFLLLVVTLKPAIAQAPLEGSAAATGQINTTTNQPASSNIDALYGNVNPNVPRNLSTLSQSTIISALSGTACILSGRDPLNPTGKCLGYDPKTGKLGYVEGGTGGAAQVMGSLIGSTASIPVSGGQYAQYAVNNFGISKPAYAQLTTNDSGGVGYQRLSPLVGVWVRFRDISYLLFVLAFTIIGLAIMFRVKIDARTVMTIQNQIPKIVVALILVTFSYAIAGFLIDMMYVLIYLVILTFSTLTPTNINPDASVFSVFNKSFQPSIHTNDFARLGAAGGFGLGGLAYDVGTSGIMNLSLEVSKTLGGTLSSIVTNFLDSTISSLFKVPFLPFSVLDVGCDIYGTSMDFLGTISGARLIGNVPVVGGFLQGVPGVGSLFGGGPECNFVESFFQLFVTFIFGTIVFLIVLIAILYTLFRVWFTLIKSFVYVLLDTMLGPLWITAGIFPGSKLNFGTWVRHIMAHLSVFPMTFAVILLGKTIMDAVASGGTTFSPPLVGDAIGGNGEALAAFVGFGFILSIPSILDKTRKAVGAIDFGLVDVRKGFAAGVGVPKEGIGSVMDYKRKSALHPGGMEGLLGRWIR